MGIFTVAQILGTIHTEIESKYKINKNSSKINKNNLLFILVEDVLIFFEIIFRFNRMVVWQQPRLPAKETQK